MTWSHALQAKLCPAAFLRVSEWGWCCPTYTFCFLLLTSAKLLPASGPVPYHFYWDAVVPVLSLSFPRASKRGNGPTGFFVAYTKKNYLIKNHWKPHAFAEMALLQRNLSRQISG